MQAESKRPPVFETLPDADRNLNERLAKIRTAGLNDRLGTGKVK